MSRFTIDSDKVQVIELRSRNAEANAQRRAAYQEETDPLVMEMLRGAVDSGLGRVPTLADIEERVAKIKERFPKGVKE